MTVRLRFFSLFSPRRRTLPSNREADVENLAFHQMSDWIAKAKSQSLDAETCMATKKNVLGGIISILAGIATDEGKAILRYSGGDSKRGTCAIPGTRIYTDSSAAAFAGSALCQVYDCNDGYEQAHLFGSSYHPGRVVIPVALAMAQEKRLSGIDFLRSVAVGYDIATHTHYAPGTPDAYGAAAVVCFANDVPTDRCAFVLRLAGFCAPKSGAEDFETNNLTCAQQARCGINAFLLSQNEYPISRARILNAPKFAFDTPFHLGGSLRRIYQKPFPTCRSTHGYIEAALRLRPSVIGRMNEIKSIRLYVKNSDFGPAHKVGQNEYYKSYQFSIPYCFAAALIDGEVGFRQFISERTNTETIQQIQEKISLSASRNESGYIDIIMSGRGHFRTSITDAVGSSDRPLSEEQIASKVVSWLGKTQDDAQVLLDAVMNVDTQETIDDLIGKLSLFGETAA